MCNNVEERPQHTTQYVQVLKEQEISTINYIECKILRSTMITHGGMHSHASIARKSLSILEPIELSSGVCHDMYTTNMYITPYQHKILNLIANRTTYTSLTELGYISDESQCRGTSFTIDGTTYIDSILTSHYSITVKQRSAIYYHSTSSVKFHDGTLCKYRLGSCYIMESTTAAWVVDAKMQKGHLSCGEYIYNNPLIHIHINPLRR